MGIKSVTAKVVAALVLKNLYRHAKHQGDEQNHVFRMLINRAKNTVFGRDHGFDTIRSYEDFKRKVPLRDYEALKPYLDRISSGVPDVCWPGRPIYLSKTSGTTSGTKYIPITQDSMSNHIRSARNALLAYVAHTGDASFLEGKMMFLQGSPKLIGHHGIPTGRLSGIVAHHVPTYLQRNRMPAMETNCIEDWETKVRQIAHETMTKDMRLISGIPSWLQMYFEILIEMNPGKTILDIFPNFRLMVYGGVNFEPYRAHFDLLIGGSVPAMELYPASEGFIAFQDCPGAKGLLPVIDNGIFYEFVPLSNIHDENPPRYMLHETEENTDYALILNTNAGLWGYILGDTVRMIETKPHRLVVSGRIAHFTSAFGEHVIASEVEQAMNDALSQSSAGIVEFHVAPCIHPADGLPFHEWFVEFSCPPEDPDHFARMLDESLQKYNVYYKDLIAGHVLQPAVLRALPRGAFNEMMKKRGKLGGQNKIPRLANDRTIADQLQEAH